MKYEAQISCIIPFWNENLHLFDVLEEIVKVRNITEIICVDDASARDISADIRRKYPFVKVIRLEQNTGKAGAVREGLRVAAHGLILLLDADLRNLDHNEIEKANEAMLCNTDLDMLILRRVNAPPAVKLYRGDILFTGERIIKKDYLNSILNGHVKGWQLESAINNWMYMNNKKVAWMPHSGVNTSKISKWGIFNGIRYDLKTYADMVSATGPAGLFRLITGYCKQELK